MARWDSLSLNLALYFLINLSLSTSNKIVLQKLPTPWLLTFMHTSFTTLGCLVCLQRGYFTTTSGLTSRHNLRLVVFSFLFAANIAMSNISLYHVSLAFHQVARSTSPIFTVAIYKVLYGRTYPRAIYLAVTAMSIGIAFTTYGDYSCTLYGGILTFLGMILATAKTIATNRLTTDEKLRLHPLELLLRMCPLASVQALCCAHISGEFSTLARLIQEGAFSAGAIRIVMANSVLAFIQNLSSFHTNKLAGALTMAICANIKQFCTVMLAMEIFETRITPSGAIGIVVVLIGTSTYSWTLVKGRGDIQQVKRRPSHTRNHSMEEKGTRT